MKLILSDYMIIITIIFMLGTHATTQYLIFSSVQGQATTANIDQITEAFEANPIAKYALRSKQIAFMFSYILMPAMIGGVYWVARRKVQDRAVLEGMATIMMLAAIINFSNDIAVLLATL